MIKKWTIIISLGLYLFLGVGNIWAEGNNSLGLVPAVPSIKGKTGSGFEYEGEAGKLVDQSAAAVNLTNEELRVQIYPVTVITNSQGKFEFLSNQEKLEEAASWLSGLPKEIVLGPKQRQRVEFAFQVPESVNPGEYYGGLVVESLEKDLKSQIRMMVKVKGETKKQLEVVEFGKKGTGQKLRFYVKLKNIGNVRIENPLIKLKLVSRWGWPPESLASYPLAMEIFPEGEVETDLKWVNSKPIFGQYQATMTVDLGGGVSQFQEIKVWLVDYLKLGITIVCLAISVLWFKLTAKKRKKKKLERQKRKLERKQMIGLATDNKKVLKHGDDVDWLLKEIRVIVREELEQLAKEGSRTRVKTPKGLKLPRGIHSKAVTNGDKKKFFFAKKKTK